MKVRYNRLKNKEKREHSLAPKPQAKRKTSVKEYENICLDSSSNEDLIEIESFAGSEKF